MGVLISGLVRLGVECPEGSPVLILRDHATDIEITEELLRGPHWAVISAAFAIIANVAATTYDYAVSVAGDLEAAVERFDQLAQDAQLPRGRSIYDGGYVWLRSPLFACSQWMQGVPEAQWERYRPPSDEDYVEQFVDPDEFLDFWKGLEKRLLAITATKAAKKLAVTKRRSEFAAARPAIVLALLDRGVPYVCAAPGCLEHEALTIDHKTPLSRGGTDTLANLQFMCRSHNSQKSDRSEAA